MQRNKKQNDSPTNDELKTSDVNGFDDLVIDVTKNRISQELTFFSSLRTRAAIFMGISGIILNLMILKGYDTILKLITEQSKIVFQHPNSLPLYFISLISGIVSISFLIGTAAFGIFLILPSKIKLADPRQINNEFYATDISKTKNALKNQLIIDLESILDNNDDAEKSLKKALKLLISGLVLLGIFLIMTTPRTAEFFK